MSQKYIKTQNNNQYNPKCYGKYYAQPVYDKNFIETEEIADFIQTQATLKRSDIKASLDELGAAMKHFLEMGQKVRLSGIGIFKVGFSSIGVAKVEDCTAATITSRRVLFQPEIERIVVGSAIKDGKVIQKYVNAKTLVKDVVFEETHDNSMNLESEDEEENGSTSGESSSGGESTSSGGSTSGGSSSGDSSSQGGSTGGSSDGGSDTGGSDPDSGDGADHN